MNIQTRRVLEEALELSSEERSELESLRAEGDPQLHEAWAELISRRTQQVLDGTAPTRDLEESLDDVEARARSIAR